MAVSTKQESARQVSLEKTSFGVFEDSWVSNHARLVFKSDEESPEIILKLWVDTLSQENHITLSNEDKLTATIFFGMDLEYRTVELKQNSLNEIRLTCLNPDLDFARIWISFNFAKLVYDRPGNQARMISAIMKSVVLC